MTLKAIVYSCNICKAEGAKEAFTPVAIYYWRMENCHKIGDEKTFHLCFGCFFNLKKFLEVENEV